MKYFLSLIIILLVSACAWFGYQYYRTDYVPNKHIRDAVVSQNELFLEMKPDVSEMNSDSTGILDSCREINSNCVGWISIPDTKIDFPIVQGSDNDFYLHHGADDEYNYEVGCPFLDYRCNREFKDFNSVVYAHNMVDDMMFSDIEKFSDYEFMSSHQKGLLTLDDGVHEIDFFAYLSVMDTAYAYKTVFITDKECDEFTEYLFTVAKHAMNVSEDEIKATDEPHLILLSTCTFEKDGARGILAGIIS